MQIVTPAPQIQIITPDEAARILSTCAFARQRRVRAAWVSELADIIKAGSWMTTSITFAECAEDGKSYLVDGYHRLNAIVRAGQSAPLIIHIEPVQTIHDVGIVYSRLDRGVPRSVIDGLTARDLPSETGLPVRVLRAGVGAVNVINAGYRFDGNLNGRRGYDEKFASIAEWVPSLRAYSEAVAGGQPRIRQRLYSAAILAVGITVFKYQPEKAYDFFHSVATTSNVSDGSAKQAFIGKLLAKNELLSVSQKVVVVGVETMCRYTAQCWNAFYRDKPLKHVKVYDASKPIILLGTPLTEWKSIPKK